jgi:5-methyltetrahydrofolate--homocysteine methyltransferase
MTRHRLHGWNKTVELRREMRDNPTQAEALLWDRLNGKQLNGLRFRRQHGVGPFIADFYHSKSATIIELDGSIHSDANVKLNDADRQKYLEYNEYAVLRFSNSEVFEDIEQVLQQIQDFIEART